VEGDTKMTWFIGIMIVIFLLFFIAMIYVEKIKDREQRDPVFLEKMEVWRRKWNPKIDFFENLFMWVFAIGLILFVYLR
jgi:sterol desaturase/sphingolipid hydroxylase (fatty acid hydroxylase superfamily)